MTKLKVLLLSTDNSGTIAKCAANLYEAFQTTSNVEVKSAIMYKYSNGESILSDSIFFIDRLSNEKANTSIINKIKWLRDIKKEFNPDIIISTQNAASILSVLSFGTEKKVGIFHAPKSQRKTSGFLYYFLTLLTYYLIFPFLSKCFCVSKEVAADLQKIFSIRKSNIQVVYNIHNIDRIKRLAVDSLLVSEEKIFSKPVALYCGRIDDNKAPIRVIDAFRYVRNEEVQLVLIGPDPYNLWDNIEARIPFDLKHRIHYLGPKSNPYSYMAKSKVVVSCSYSEGLPGVLIESLALGVPVVTTNSSSGNWEILSCSNDYNENLVDNYQAVDGIITSNLSNHNPSAYDSDVENLGKAINEMLTSPRIVKFNFASLISSSEIISKFLKVVR